MGETVQANDGAMLPLGSLPCQLVFNGGFIESITVNYAGRQYVQTFENNGTNITYISGWNNPLYPDTEQLMVDSNGVQMVSDDGSLMFAQQ